MTSRTPLSLAFRRPWPGTRRGLCLWLFSISFMFLGLVNYVLTEPPPLTREALSFAFDLAPVWFWGLNMFAAGLLAFIFSYCHFGRDRYGFTALSTFCAGWGLVYWCGYWFYDASLRAVSGSVTWFLFSGILALVAGFPNVALRQPPLVIRNERKEE